MSFTVFFFFNDTAPTEIYTLSLHDALPISRRLPRGGSGGLAVKFIREMIDPETATAGAFDLGGRLPLGGSGVSLGAALQNVGGDAKFITESFPLPRTIRAGAAITRAIPSLEGSGTLSANATA